MSAAARGAALLALLAASAAGTAQPPPIELSDSSGRRVALGAEQPGLPPRLLVVSDRGGSRFSKRWSRRLVGLEPALRLIDVAHLADVPAVARPLVRRAFRDSPAVLLDWHGALARRFGFEPDRVNVYLLDAAGRLLLAASGGDAEEDLAGVVARLEEALAAGSPP